MTMTYSLEEKVKWFATTSRIVLLTLQLIFNIVIPDHDAGVFIKPRNTNNTTIVDQTISYIISGLTNWDGQYFLHVAEYGYTYENTLVFFPLFPLICRQLGYLIFIIFYSFSSLFYFDIIILEYSTCIGITGILLNNFLFIKSCVILFKLSLLLLKNERLSYISAILFCVNPASIFFSSFYSESLYCFIFLYSMLRIEKQSSDITLGMTALVRSNGVINIGFMCHRFIKNFNKKYYSRVLYCVSFILRLIFTLIPFLMFQVYCYIMYCKQVHVTLPHHIINHARDNNFELPSSEPDWCRMKLPLAYSAVQNKYWDVGLFKYYELKQIPSFILAFPVIFIVLSQTYSYFKKFPRQMLSLGLKDTDTLVSENQLPPNIMVYTFHCLFLTIFCCLFVHIQVTTRMICSSCPVFYWYCSCLIVNSLPTQPVINIVQRKFYKKLNNIDGNVVIESLSNRKSRWLTVILTEKLNNKFGLFVKYYFLFYYVVGTALFSNFLPWT